MGDSGYMMFCITMVMVQTPGIGFLQAGLIRRKNAISILLQVFCGTSIGSVLWWICGFSMAFGPSMGGFIGDPRAYPMFVGEFIILDHVVILLLSLRACMYYWASYLLSMYLLSFLF